MGRAESKKPLILRVVSRMAIGGVQNGIVNTLARFDRQKRDYALLCTKKEGKWSDRVRTLGVPVYCQKTLPPWDPYQIWRLSRVIRRINPDLVHIHMAPLVIPVGTACKLAGVRRVIVQWHNHYDRFWYGEQNAFLRAWERRLTRGADAVLSVAGPAADVNAPIMGVPREKVRVITNGIDLKLWQTPESYDPRPEWGLAPETQVVVHVSRYLDTKRIEDFIQAAQWLCASWPGDRPVPAFVVIGDGPETYRRHYEAHIARISNETPQAKIVLAGERTNLPALLKTVQAGVLASENEGCPNVILEYMAARVPIVATHIAPIAELARDGETALLAPPRNPAELAASIRRVLLEPELAARLRANALNEAHRHDWQATAMAYETVYEEVLKRES